MPQHGLRHDRARAACGAHAPQKREVFWGSRKDVLERPLIGMVGEIYVRSNVFSNENVIKKVEELGGEVWLAPFGEWICTRTSQT